MAGRRAGAKCQTVCKPGSVHTLAGAGRPFIWDTHCCVPRATNPGDEAEPLRGHDRSRRRSPLFGLAPGGVFPAAPVAGGAVRSYRTFSPLPAGRGVPAVCSLWHFPWGRPRRPLAGTVIPWSPDFPPRRERHGGRPTVWLALLGRSPAPGQWAANRARIAPARARVPASATPSTRSGRNRRWNAVTTASRSSVTS